MERKLFRFNRLRGRIHLFLPVLFLFISLTFIILGASDATSLVKTRKVVFEFISPIVQVIQAPIHWIKNGAIKVKNWSLTYHENEKLKKENSELLKWQALAFEYKTKMEELQKQQEYVFPPKATHLMAEIMFDEKSTFSRSFLVWAGEKEGVKKGMLAFGPKTLMGRIVDVSDHFSQVMPLIDTMSRVPVWVGEEKFEAFLIGDNSETPFLQLIHSDDKIQKGDIVMTSGYVGVYPANIVLGFVKSVQEEDVRVCLYESGLNISVVQLVDYHLTKSILLEDKK